MENNETVRKMEVKERIESIRNAVKAIQFELRKIENVSLRNSIHQEIWLICQKTTEFEQDYLKSQE